MKTSHYASEIPKFLKGLILTFLAVLAFCALNWITLTAQFNRSTIIIPVIITCIVSLVMYSIVKFMTVVVVVHDKKTIAGLIELAIMIFIGYIALRVAISFLPGWIAVTSDIIPLAIMGFCFSLVYTLVK